MARVILKQQAVEDLNDIYTYTFEEWSEKQADKYYATLEFACLQIGKNPELGKRYIEINNEILGLRIGKHIIFYQIITEEEVEIVRILHEKMDLKYRMYE